jgi:hypothetical protein
MTTFNSPLDVCAKCLHPPVYMGMNDDNEEIHHCKCMEIYFTKPEVKNKHDL